LINNEKDMVITNIVIITIISDMMYSIVFITIICGVL